MKTTELVLEASDGQRLAGVRWESETGAEPRAVVQIAHGASEHSGRYARIAEVLVDAGYTVHAVDHRGHGRTAEAFGRFGVARPGGWEAMIVDTHELTERIRAELPDVPVVLFGHSMGSMLAQAYVQRWGDELAGVVLSGTTGGLALDDDTFDAVTGLGEGDTADDASAMFAAMFAGFNEPFDEPGATGFEWLSRDGAEVQRYVDDAWCGETLSNGFVADMLGGTRAMWRPEAEAAVPHRLPMLVLSGDRDPVGGDDASSVRDLVDRYESMGVGPITLRIYPDGRHEMLNETNREEVHADLLAWLEGLVL